MTFTRTETSTSRARSAQRLLPLLAVLAMLLAACGGGDGGTEPTGDTTDAGTDASGGDATVVLGLVTATQGNIAFAGTSYLKGAELAVEQINAAGGLQVELRTEEGSEVPEQVVNAFNRLASDGEVDGVICCILSPVAGAVKPVSEAAGVPLMIYGATLPGLANPPYTYRSASLPQEGNRQLAQRIVDTLAPDTVAYTVTADNEGMLSQLEAFREPFEAAGVEDLGVTETLAADTDFSGAATEVISKSPDVVVVSQIGEPSAGMIKALRDRGYEGTIVANATISTKPIFDSAGEALVGAPFPIEYSPASTVPAAKEFTAAYEEKFGETPDTYSSQGYVAVQVMAEGARNAVDAAGEVDRESLAEGLAAIGTMDTVWGPLAFDGGQATAESILFATWSSDGTVQPWEPPTS